MKVTNNKLIIFSKYLCDLFINSGIDSLWKINSPTLSSVQQNTVIQLIQRLLPDRANEFEVVINTKLLENDFKDKFIVSNKQNDFY